MKRKVLLIVAVVLIIIAIATPSYFAVTARSDVKQKLETQQLQVAFIARYGTTVQLLDITKPQEFYMFYWKDTQKVYVAMLVDGIWVELGNQPLPAQLPQPAPTP
jgi:type II secretory pathway pseudopilin PulG